MKTRWLLCSLFIFLQPLNTFAACNNLLDFEARQLHSEETINLCKAYQGKVILMVNTASQCGFTPQFKELEILYQRYKDKGLAIIGFPSNDFNQEHGDEAKTADVCYLNYGVSFQMLSTSHVRGENANAVFKQLARSTGKAPAWNFNKYIVNQQGKVLKYFPSQERPVGGELEKTLVKALGL